MIYILAPYRNRPQQLISFIDHYKYFRENGYEFKIIIIEQGNDKPFNKGCLLNNGVKVINEQYSLDDNDILIFNDIDCLLKKHKIEHYFKNPENQVRHIYGYARIYFRKFNCLGGIISMNYKTFKTINGFPNNFWGWGGEDLALGFRSIYSKVKINVIGMIPYGNKVDIIHHQNPVSKESSIKKRHTNIININKLLIETKNPKLILSNGYDNCSYISKTIQENENSINFNLDF